MLPESSVESVLEDLVAADRYRLLTMKRICQSMIRLSADNCLQVSTVDEIELPPQRHDSRDLATVASYAIRS